MYGQGITRGRVGILMNESATNQACAGIIPNEKFDSTFLFYQLQYLYSHLRKLGRGGGRPNLNLNIIKNYEVLTPIIKDNLDIDKFTTIVTQVEIIKEKYQNSLKELNELFASLSQKAFKGELDLSKMKLAQNQDESLQKMIDIQKVYDKALETKVYEAELTNVETVSIKSISKENLETYIFDLIKLDSFSIMDIQHLFETDFTYNDVKEKIFKMLEEEKIKHTLEEYTTVTERFEEKIETRNQQVKLVVSL